MLLLQVTGGESTIATVARKCVGYVGADLAALAREAALLAARYAYIFQRGSCFSSAAPVLSFVVMLVCNDRH